MQKSADDVKTWMTVNKLKFSDDKTKAMIVSSGRKSRSLSPSFPHSLTIVVHLSKPCVLHLIGIWPGKYISNLLRSAKFELRCISFIRRLLSTDAIHILVPAFVLSRLDYCNSLLSGCPQYLLNKLQKNSKQRYSPCTKSSQNRPYLSSPCLSPLAAHWFTNTVQTRFNVLQLPQLGRSCLLDWTAHSLQTNPPAALYLGYFYSLSSLCAHALTCLEIFFLRCIVHLSGTVSLAKLDHQTHSYLSHHLCISPLQAALLTVCACVRACVCACVRVCVCVLAEVCFDCVLVLCLVLCSCRVLQLGEIAHWNKIVIITNLQN